MKTLIEVCRKTIRNLVRREPGIRFGGEDADLLPAILPGHWYSAYQIGRHYRDSLWYFERHFEHRASERRGDWPESRRR
jgi:hypothetical protein